MRTYVSAFIAVSLLCSIVLAGAQTARADEGIAQGQFRIWLPMTMQASAAPAPAPTPTPPPTPPFEDGQCRGTLGAIEVENVTVPVGAACTLNGTNVKGNIVVQPQANLQANQVRVGGNIQAEGAASVVVTPGSFVDGSVQIKQGGSANVSGVTIRSDLQLESNRGAVNAASNQVDGNVQVVQNTGGIVISNNQIAQSLQCKENNPAPTGGGNTAGDKEDQCVNL